MILLQNLQAELVHLKTDVTNLNQNADSLSKTGDKHAEQVKKQISAVNSAYEELLQQSEVLSIIDFP